MPPCALAHCRIARLNSDDARTRLQDGQQSILEVRTEICSGHRCPPLWSQVRTSLGLPWIAAVGSLAASRGCHGPLELVVVLLQIMKLYAIYRRSVETASRTALRTAKAGSSGVGALALVRRSGNYASSQFLSIASGWSQTMQPSWLPLANLLPRFNHALTIEGNFAFNV